ncbi:FecR domain-containing protein [Pseudomonas sichuanensis]|uniref:FecR family protein n=1 Tax=Pseudomonas sichuanensis TaxID=2213015 RepID=UPI00244B3C7B|nr:FecR domain-containing protein [Pseudomonas sichuanensis]MDH0733944.1 FecR domain-containing protein [Pseudomonas sichuanensis]MDH1582547.1 FecR domain-containing protein [Pseudomonas sichuanensis]MDH1592460.1 FecR domain-containing protein [Pseudomonas sichuanensis]MDH1597788.1 FecR domain-containing protein [Pseudomonas sichuanensis]
MNDTAAMPAPHPLSNLSDDALDWQVLLHSGTATAADRARYQRWRQLSAAHAEAAGEAEALWQDLGHTPTAQALHQPPAPRRWRRLSAIAASLAMLMAGYGAWLQLPVWQSDYHTSVGQRQILTLADGSRVTLNSGSAVSVAYSADQRKVVLQAGEALFETVDDPRPFVVEAGGEPVSGSAAVFSVRRQAEGNRVVLAQGEARVGGQVLQPTPDAGAQTAWQRGKLIFNGKPLGQVLAELERYQHGRIFIPDQQLAALQVSGVFDLDDPHALLRTLEQRYGLKVTYLPFLAVVY